MLKHKKKIAVGLIVAGASTLFLSGGLVDVCYLGNDSANFKQFDTVFCEDIAMNELIEAKIIEGSVVYDVFRSGGKLLREKSDKVKYESIKASGRPERNQHLEWAFSYETISFDTPNGDLTGGYFAFAGYQKDRTATSTQTK